MERNYRVSGSARVLGHKPGTEFAAEFDPETEEAHIRAGRLEVQPTKYVVAGLSRTLGHEPGEEFEAGLSQVQEQRLLAGGHLERAPEAPAPQRKPPKSKE